jgi:hypothetical protein
MIKLPERYNIPSELNKCGSEKFKIIFLKFVNKMYVSGTTPAECNSAIVLQIYKKGNRKIQKTTIKKIHATHFTQNY